MTEQNAAVILAVLASQALVEFEDGEKSLQYLINASGYHLDDYLEALDIATDEIDNNQTMDILLKIVEETVKDVAGKANRLN